LWHFRDFFEKISFLCNFEKDGKQYFDDDNKKNYKKSSEKIIENINTILLKSQKDNPNILLYDDLIIGLYNNHEKKIIGLKNNNEKKKLKEVKKNNNKLNEVFDKINKINFSVLLISFLFLSMFLKKYSKRNFLKNVLGWPGGKILGIFLKN
jgi:hypothetical protein